MLIITQDIIDDFRMYMSSFSDETKYPDALVRMYLEEASEETGDRWGRYSTALLRRRGMFNYAAHKLTLREIGEAAGVVGMSPDVVASKSVGDESVSYAVATPDVNQQIRYGDLRSTAYGLEFLRLRMRIIGPIVV